jgi:hypothetical protein
MVKSEPATFNGERSASPNYLISPRNGFFDGLFDLRVSDGARQVRLRTG